MLARRGAPGRDRTCDHRIRRVIDAGDWAFYLRLRLQSIILELLRLLRCPQFASRLASRLPMRAARPHRRCRAVPWSGKVVAGWEDT